MWRLTSTDREALTAFAQQLIRTPSPSTQEKAVAELVAAELRKIGFPEVWVDRIGNVVARAGDGSGPSLLFNAHMDTVEVNEPEAWTHPPLGGVVENGILYGRGAVDMKGPLAAMVYGLKMVLDAGVPLHGNLYVAAVVQEEPCEGYAMRVLVEEEGLVPDMVVLCEPSNLQLAIGQRGRMEMRVTVRGVAAHSSMPEQGENAIYRAARIIFGVELLSSQLAVDSILGQGSVAVTHIESSASSRNAIPDRCVFYIDRRLTLGETEARALAEIQAIITREQARASVEVTEYQATSYTGYPCRARTYFPAWLMPEDHPLVRAGVRAVEQALDYRPRLIHWLFSTDGAYTMGMAGIPTIGIGPGEVTQAHAVDEHVRLEDLYHAASVYATLAADLLGG
ncbi:MAG: YgeY family selenium metabolism-linked hydrolase [Anaerolineae bacterium]|nr:YgeY family selenium metabolism-linked hydrolase [Anaerolineae bacterium]